MQESIFSARALASMANNSSVSLTTCANSWSLRSTLTTPITAHHVNQGIGRRMLFLTLVPNNLDNCSA